MPKERNFLSTVGFKSYFFACNARISTIFPKTEWTDHLLVHPDPYPRRDDRYPSSRVLTMTISRAA